jgi:hypothetical protein
MIVIVADDSPPRSYRFLFNHHGRTHSLGLLRHWRSLGFHMASVHTAVAILLFPDSSSVS